MTEHGEMRAMATVDWFVLTLPGLRDGHAVDEVDEAMRQALLEVRSEFTSAVLPLHIADADVAVIDVSCIDL